jgi:hypothetical protein
MALASADILDRKQQRLYQLELQAATYGNDTPPHISTEISDLRRELSAAAPAAIAESHDILFTLIGELRTDVRRLYWLVPVLLLIVVVAVKL